jgi:hypothetical protein
MSDDQRPVWDDAFAQSLLGNVLLVGLTYVEPNGDRQEQFHGKVVSVDPQNGICLRLAGARDSGFYWLPPNLHSIHPARPGAYRLRSTGETVNDPDYTAAWTIHPKTPADIG